MFGMSLPEIAMVLVLGLIVFGPKRIPQVAFTVGKVIREMRKAANEVRRTIDVEDLRNDLRLRNMDRQPPAGSVASKSPLPTSSTGTAAPKRTEVGASSHLETSSTRRNTGASTPAPAPSGPAQSDPGLESRLKAYLSQTNDDLEPVLLRHTEIPSRREPDADSLTTVPLAPAKRAAEQQSVSLPERA